MGLRPRRMVRRRRRRARTTHHARRRNGRVRGSQDVCQSQAKQVEEHTGVPPEELEDEDLEAAMAELNIPKQELTDEDRRGRSWHRRLEAVQSG